MNVATESRAAPGSVAVGADCDPRPEPDSPDGWSFADRPALEAMAARARGTPFFAYDRSAVDRRIAKLRSALPDDVGLLYSVKANPFYPLVHHISRGVDGFDVSSAAELTLALDTGMKASGITFAGPGKSNDELRLAIAVGATVSIESAGELDRIDRIAGDLGRTPQVMLRVNPDLDLPGVGMRMGGEARQFGVDIEQCPALLRRLAAFGDAFRGYHVYWGSQCLDADVVAAAQAQTIDALVSLASIAGHSPALFNIGGGFGIPYSSRAQPLDLTAVGAALEMRMAALRREFPALRVVVELGRYLVGEAGIYVCKVLERKTSRGQVFLVTDGGLHHHLSASGNLGQLIKRNYPMFVGGRAGADADERVHVAGRLCTPIDLLARDISLPRAEVDDLVVITQSGAYGPSSSPAGFLSHPAAAELLV